MWDKVEDVACRNPACPKSDVYIVSDSNGEKESWARCYCRSCGTGTSYKVESTRQAAVKAALSAFDKLRYTK